MVPPSRSRCTWEAQAGRGAVHRGRAWASAPPADSEPGKAASRRKDARGLAWFWSMNDRVPPAWGVNRQSRTRVAAVVNATHLTSPVVTPEAACVKPWRARCRETGPAGSEGGVRKHRWAVRLAPTLPVLSECNPLDLHTLTPAHRGPRPPRCAALEARQADVARAGRVSSPPE
jgi:hypothetical protein